MPYLKLNLVPCSCKTPAVTARKSRRALDAGTVWECPDCGQQYELVSVAGTLEWKKLSTSAYLPSKR